MFVPSKNKIGTEREHINSILKTAQPKGGSTGPNNLKNGSMEQQKKLRQTESEGTDPTKHKPNLIESNRTIRPLVEQKDRVAI